MKNTSFLFGILTVLLASTAQAQLVLPVGNYRSTDGCRLEITRKTDGHTSFRVDKGNVYAAGEFRNPILSRSEQILSVGTCHAARREMLGPRGVIPGSKTEFKVVNSDNHATTYLTRCGGTFEVVDFRIYWAVSTSDSSLVALRADNYIASFGTMSGYHSGPIKTNSYPLTCQKFTKTN
ncbi:MAG: hypothetical protein ABL958_06015 [Bdellovibrionia bacterium]